MGLYRSEVLDMMTRRLSIRVDSSKSNVLVKTSLVAAKLDPAATSTDCCAGGNQFSRQSSGWRTFLSCCDVFWRQALSLQNDYCESNRISKRKIKVRIIDIGWLSIFPTVALLQSTEGLWFPRKWPYITYLLHPFSGATDSQAHQMRTILVLRGGGGG